MKNIFKPGSTKQFMKVVISDDFAIFNGEVVHPVMSTYALARDMEWTSRLFVIDMRDDDEEGIGTFVHVEHHAPAFEGEELAFTATVEQLNGHELICSLTVRAGERLVASGRTGQKVFKREKIKKLLEKR